MAFDALRGYVQLANGLTDVTRQRALQAARQMLEQGGDVVDLAMSTAASAGVARQAQALAEDLLATSRTNRDLMIGLVRTEVERAVARMGLVGADELAAMTRVVDRLQSQLDAAIAFGGELLPSGSDHGRGQAAAPARQTPPAQGRPPTKVAAKKVPPKKVPATTAMGESTRAKKATAKKVAAKQTANKPSTRKVTAKKAAAQKPAAKKPAAKKPAAKKPAAKKPAAQA